MRYVLVLFFVVVFSCSKRDINHSNYIDVVSTEYPFQVLGTHKSYIQKGEIYKKKLLGTRDTINIHEQGYLILMHHTGFMYEVNGDTVFTLQNLNREIAKTLDIREHKMQTRVEIEQLYSDEIDLIYSNAVTRHFSYFEIANTGKSNSITLSSSNPRICLQLIGSMEPTQKYYLKAVNIFNETDSILLLESNNIEIELPNFKCGKQTCIFQIVDETMKNELSDAFAVRLGPQYQYHTDICQYESPISNLETAYHFERNGYPTLASKYYEKASELSNKQFYQEVLDLFYQRNPKEELEYLDNRR